MAGRSTYTEEEKARVYVALAANDGNIKRTARELGLPETTVRNFRNRWKRGEATPNLDHVQAEVDTLLADIDRVQNKLLRAIEKKVDEGEGKLSELGTLFGILNDKYTRASGLDRKSQVDHFHHLPSAEELRELMASVVPGAIEAASKQDEIIDAEIVEVKALPA